MKKVTRRSVAVEFILYTTFSCFAYLSFHEETKGNVLLNYSEQDFLFTVARTALVFSLSVVCPLVFSPAQADIERLLFKHKEFSWPRHVSVAFLLVASATFLAIYAPEVSFVFGILGATFAIFFCFALPILLYLHTRSTDESPITRVLLLVLLVVLVCIGAGSVGETLYGLVLG